MNEQMQIRIEQVRTELQAGTGTAKIAHVFAGEWNVSTRTVKRVIRKVQEELDDERRIEQTAREKALEKYSSELAEQEIKDQLQINATLMEIIKGSARIKKMFYTTHGLVEKEIEPDFKEIIRASEVLNKRTSARANERQKEKENVNKPEPDFFFEDDYDDLSDIFDDEPGNSVNEPAANYESVSEVQSEQEEASHLAATVSPQRDEAQHLEDTTEEPVEKEKENENEKGKESENVNVQEPTKETKRNTHPPRTSTFNKWAVPFMPQQYYRNQQRVRVKNYPVK